MIGRTSDQSGAIADESGTGETHDDERRRFEILCRHFAQGEARNVGNAPHIAPDDNMRGTVHDVHAVLPSIDDFQLPIWRVCYSKTKGYAYWYNRMTGESRWHRPDDDAEHDAGDGRTQSLGSTESSGFRPYPLDKGSLSAARSTRYGASVVSKTVSADVAALIPSPATRPVPQLTTPSEQELREHFYMPLHEVAKKYGKSTAVLKKLCRKCGVMQWPHRKLRSLQKKIASLRVEQRFTSDRGHLDAEIHKLEAQRQALICGTGEVGRDEPVGSGWSPLCPKRSSPPPCKATGKADYHNFASSMAPLPCLHSCHLSWTTGRSCQERLQVVC